MTVMKNHNGGNAVPSPSYDSGKPLGFGANAKGGNNQNIIVVGTAEELRAAVSGTTPATIYVKDSISLDKMLSVGSNKSIIGLTGAVISNLNRNENAGIFLLKGSNNVIIRNLTLLGPGAYDIDANYSDNISAVGACRKRQRRMRLKIIVAARTSTSKSWTVWE